MLKGYRITELREKKGLSQAQLARLADISNDYMHKIEAGKITNVGIEIIERILKALGANIAEVTESESSSFGDGLAEDLRKIKIHPDVHTNKLKLIGRPIPVIGKASCGHWKDFTDLDYPPGHADEWATGITKDPNAFYVIAYGDSMVDGDIKEGDYLLVEPNKPITNNCKVLAKDPRYGCTVKLFFKEKDGRIRLQPMNPKYPPIYIENGEDFRAYRITKKLSDI